MHARLGAVFGSNVRAARRRAGLTQDTLAAAARAAGLEGWSQATVAGVEAGRREVRVEELLLMAVSLGVTPAELLRANDDITVAVGSAVWPATAVTSVLAGTIDPALAAGGGAQRNWTPRAGEKVGATARRIAVATADPDRLATRKAARRLGITPGEVVALAVELWGHGLEEERAARAPDGASQQQLAGVTRGLIDHELIPAALAAGYLTEK